MRQRLRRGILWLMLALTGATLFQTTATSSSTVAFTSGNGAIGGCARFATNGLLEPVNFCYILDCQSGFLGGAIQPCGSSATTDMLVDCPATTSGQSSTTNTTTTGT